MLTSLKPYGFQKSNICSFLNFYYTSYISKLQPLKFNILFYINRHNRKTPLYKCTQIIDKARLILKPLYSIFKTIFFVVKNFFILYFLRYLLLPCSWLSFLYSSIHTRVHIALLYIPLLQAAPSLVQHLEK